MELGQYPTLRLEPFRGAGLEFLNHIAQGVGFRQTAEDVHVIFDAIDHNCGRVEPSEHGSPVCVQFGAKLRHEKWIPFLRAENDVNQNLRQ